MKISVQAVKTIEASKVKVQGFDGYCMSESNKDLIEITFTGGARLDTLGNMNADGSARTLNYKSISIGDSFHLMTMFDGIVVSLVPEILGAWSVDPCALADLGKRLN